MYNLFDFLLYTITEGARIVKRNIYNLIENPSAKKRTDLKVDSVSNG